MVDLHSHILHGLDDGAYSLDMSIQMARLAIAAGTTDIVATPHADHEYTYSPLLVEQRREELQRLAGTDLRIHRGCDLHLSYDNIRQALKSPSTYAINGLKYLLVELSDLMVPASTEEVFSELQGVGLLPIVTHPERNPLLAGDLPRLERWVEQGSYIQVTAQSLLGQFGPEAARCSVKLLDRGLAHFVASDGHDPVQRPPRLDLARTYLRRRYSDDYADLLLEINPRCALWGQALDPGPIVAPKPAKSWFQFWP